MDESGYCDAMSQHSNNANDDSTITVTAEPVDLVIEKDGSLLLSNLQSVLPGAHGLYYYHLGHKKAVKFDGQSAKIFPPSDGWGARSYFVTLAHGCRGSWHAFGSYENASKQFERSVSLVQKLFGGTESVESEKRKSLAIKRDAEIRSRSQPATVSSNGHHHEESVRAEQDVESSPPPPPPERLSHLEVTIDQLTNTLTAKEHEIQLLKEENHELRSQTDNYQSATNEDAQQAATDLREQLNERVDAYNKSSEENASLRVRIDDLIKELEDTRSRLDHLNQSSTEERQKFEREAGEVHQQWNDAKWRVGELEAALGSVNADASHKNDRIAHLESELASVSNQLRESYERNNELERTISSKQHEVDELRHDADKLRHECESHVARNTELVECVSSLEQQLADARKVQEEAVKVEYNHVQQSSATDENEERVRDLEQQLAELRDSYNRLEQDGTLQRQKLEWELGETNLWLNDARLRSGELEENLRQRGEYLAEKERTIESLTEQLQSGPIDHDECKRAYEELERKFNEMNSRKEYVEQELTAAKKHIASGGPSSPVRKADPHEDMLELSDELMKVNLRKYELENTVSQLSADLKSARQRANSVETTQQEIEKNLWLTGERLAEVEREKHHLQSELNEAYRLVDQLRHELSQRKERIAQDDPEVHHLQEELRVARENRAEVEAREIEARQNIEWRLGEVTQAWNDAKWKIGELEAGLAHNRWELDQARLRIHELEQLLEKLQMFKSKASKVLDGSFLIRKQPYVDRTKWSLSMWDENSPSEDDLEYRRVWFDIDAPNARNVYLMGSFVNWECGMMCTATEPNGDKKGVWVDLPRGRYEFRFLVDGEWRTATEFPTCWNDFGSHNNWRFVE